MNACNSIWLVERTKKSATEGGDDSATAVDIYPESGRLAMFLSAEMPHEVMPTFGDRHAITIWYIFHFIALIESFMR